MTHDGTTSIDYGQGYYNEAHLGGHGDYSWDNEHWRNFFMSVADRLIGALNPGTVLDVGCARGLLVQSFTVQGIEAGGFDVSEHAIASAHEEIRERLSVASATEPIAGRYDLVTCIEVLEHMSAVDAQSAIDQITAVTDRVLFSSSPEDHDEPTHINTNPTEHWVSWFAERGFFRRVDLDMSMIAPWAVVFERGAPSLHELTQRYEQLYSRTRTELLEKRRALLEADRRLNSLSEGVDQDRVDPEELDRLRAEVVDARHRQLVSRDHIVGLEAETGRLNRDLSLAATELKKSRRRIERLSSRRDELTQRLQETRQKLERNRARVAELEATAAPSGKRSITRKVARRVRRMVG